MPTPDYIRFSWTCTDCTHARSVSASPGASPSQMTRSAATPGERLQGVSGIPAGRCVIDPPGPDGYPALPTHADGSLSGCNRHCRVYVSRPKQINAYYFNRIMRMR